MKTISTLLFAMLLAPTLSFCQEWSLGVKAIPQKDFNFSSNAPAPNAVFVSTLSSGFGLNYKFCYNSGSYYCHNKNSISVETIYRSSHLLYARKDTDMATTDFAFKTIEIPVLWQIRSDDWGLYAELGASYSHTFKQTVDPKNTIPLSFKANNIDGVLGFGFDSKISPKVILTIGVRGYYPLLDMTQNSGEYSEYYSTHIVRAGAVVGLSYYFDYFYRNLH